MWGTTGQIGRGLARSPGRLAAAVGVAALVVSADLLVLDPHAGWLRLGVGLGGAALVLALAGDRRSLGLTLRPRRSWSYWGRAGLILGGIVLAVSGLLVSAKWALGSALSGKPLFADADQAVRWMWAAVLIAPLVEEPIYRLVLCPPLAAGFGKWPTVALSGLTFAGLHVVYGNPGPDNAVAGFLLGWAYLESESIVLPIALHALGNLCVGLGNLAYLYWIT